MTAAVAAVALSLALFATSTQGQASDGSGATDYQGVAAPQAAVPTDWATATPAPTMGSWPSGSYYSDWRGSSSQSSSSIDSSSSGYGDDDEVGVEYYVPDIDGSINMVKRRTYSFDPMSGFSLSTTDTMTGVQPGNCSGYAYCVHVVFESDYGAMSALDAFYLDSYESVGGPVGTESFTVDGGAPLVLGRFSKESIQRLGENWSHVFNWNDTRRTTWTFYPTTSSDAPRFNEIDLTLSLKQVYMALPDYNSKYADETNMGPLYSSSLTDQVVIRLNAHYENGYTSASAMLPIVVNHTGSQLVDMNITTTHLFANDRNDSNEIQLTIQLGRHKYGGLAPWIPAAASSCFNPPSWFAACPEASSSQMRQAMEDLLAHKANAIDIRPIIKMCAATASESTATTAAPTNWPETPTNEPTRSASGSSGGDHPQSSSSATNDPGPPPGGESPPSKRRLSDASSPTDPLQDMESALRPVVHGYPYCAFNDITMKSDGQGVTLRHEPATTRIDFGVPSFSFYLVLQIDNETDTTHVFTSGMSPVEIVDGIRSVLPVGREWLELSVRFANNTDEIDDVKRRNRATMDAYEEALRWSGTWAPSRDSSSSDNSAGSDGVDQSNGSTPQLSEEGGGNSGAGEETVGPFASPVRPKKPSLLPVPMEKYSVFIEFSTLVLVPHVLAVFSPNSGMAFSSNDGKLQLEAVPLLQTDLKYAPPPEDLDLDWHVEPLWKTKARNLLRKLSVRFSCGKCLTAFEACLLNEDCVFGVNSYFGEAVQSQQWGNETSDTPAELDVSDVVRQARPFFPGRGFEKLQGLLLCWAKQGCDLNAPAAPVFDETTGKWETAPASRTVLVFEPTEIDLLISQYQTFAVYANGDKQYWSPWIGCSPSELQKFVSRNVLRAEPSYVRSFTLRTNCNDWWFRLPTYQYNLTWADGFVDPIQVDVDDQRGYDLPAALSGQSKASSVVRPWTLTIKTSSQSLRDGQLTPWPQLLSWLNVFQSVPFGLSLGADNNASNTTTSTDGSDPIQLPVPPSALPSAVCPACADTLVACVSNVGCATAARAWLAWVLPGPGINGTADWDGFTRLRWLGNPFSNDSVSSEYRDTLLKFVVCIAKHNCAVGYGPLSTQSDMVIPTTVRLQVMRKMVAPSVNTAVQLVYANLSPVVLNSYEDPQPFIDQIKAAYDDDISSYMGTSYDGYTLNFTGSFEAIQRLSITGYERSGGVLKLDTYGVRFQSPMGTTPSWSYLLAWFGVNTTRSNDAICTACLPKLHTCYQEANCWWEIQKTVLPVLERKLGWLETSSEFVSDGHTRYKADVGAQLANYGNSVSKTSWWLFMDIVRCFAASKCDVATMDSAVEPPATAYVPSFIMTEPARIMFLLYPDTTLSTWNGNTYSHTGSMADLTMFLNRALGISTGGLFSIVETSPVSTSNNMYEVPGPGATAYNVTFSEAYFEPLPYIDIQGSGKIPMTDSDKYRYQLSYARSSSFRITIESMNQWPQWDRLINRLSVPPKASSDFLSDCAAAQEAKRGCTEENSYSCKYDLAQNVQWSIGDTLRTSGPGYNPSTGFFEVDFTYTAQNAGAYLLKLYETAAQCAAAGAPLGSRPTFQRGSVRFTRPNTGPLMVQTPSGSASIDDQAMSEAEFRDYFNTSTIFQSSTYGSSLSMVSVVSWAKMEDQILYELETTWIGSNRVTLSWDNETASERIYSTTTPGQMGFQSESYNMYAAALPWLNWLRS